MSTTIASLLLSWIAVMICVVRNVVVITVVMSSSAQCDSWEGGERPELNNAFFGRVIVRFHRHPDLPVGSLYASIPNSVASTGNHDGHYIYLVLPRSLPNQCVDKIRVFHSPLDDRQLRDLFLRPKMGYFFGRLQIGPNFGQCVSGPSLCLLSRVAGRGGSSETRSSKMFTVFRANPASVGFAALARHTEIGHAKRGADNHDRVCEYESRAPSRDIIGMRRQVQRYQPGPASPAIICDEQPFSLSSLVRVYGLLLWSREGPVHVIGIYWNT